MALEEKKNGARLTPPRILMCEKTPPNGGDAWRKSVRAAAVVLPNSGRRSAAAAKKREWLEGGDQGHLDVVPDDIGVLQRFDSFDP